MNDPHVRALVYRVKHDPSVNYEKAQPVECETDAFTVRLSEDEARFELKDHFASVPAA
jgi:hypothetical protein